MAQSILPLLFTIFFTNLALTIKQAPKVEAFPPPLNAFVSPITKDAATSLYSLSFYGNISFLLDLNGPLSWSPCPSNHPTFPCSSPTCLAAQFFPPPANCPKLSGSNYGSHPCNCTASVVNPVTGKCTSGDLTLTTVTLFSTNGSNPTAIIQVNDIVSSCAPKSLLKSLPAGTSGVAGLARSNLTLPSQLFSKFFLKTQFAVCLPSEVTVPGVAFFGSGPFNLMPPTPFDVASILQYTLLLKSPINPGYYIDVKGIAVSGKTVPLPSDKLKLDLTGHGGVKISTAVPYTVLRRDIYKPFLKAYNSATAAIPRMPKVKPFDLCFNSSALGFSRVGYIVPQIDLMLSDGKNWTVFGVNSVKQVNQGTVCLAFVDGGPKAEPAVVLGGFQIENNFLLFDVGRSMLGFSSTLYFIRTTCGNFDFTLGG